MWILLLLAMLTPDGPPYYKRPASVPDDLKLLAEQRQKGTVAPAFWLARLALYTEIAELKEASPLVLELSELFPSLPQFLEAKMILLSLEGKNPEALALGERIIHEHPDYLTIHTNLARIYLKNGKRAEGINLMLQSMETTQVRIEDWELLLQSLGLGTMDANKLLEQLRAKCAQHPESKGLKYSLVLVCTRLGQYAEARQILNSDPTIANHPDLQSFLEGFEPVQPTPGGTP